MHLGSHRPHRRRRDGGFTTLELMIACLVLSVVVAISGAVLISLTSAARRNDAVVSNEQRASSVITQLSRDVRSANSVSFPSSSPSTELEFQVNEVTGATVTTVPVLWNYTTSSACTAVGLTAPCLLREQKIGGTFQAQGAFSISLANDTTTNPVFTYYTFSSPGTPLSTTDSMTEYSTCTTAIGVDLVVSSTTLNSSNTFEDTDQIALTNQVNTLTAPGNGDCR